MRGGEGWKGGGWKYRGGGCSCQIVPGFKKVCHGADRERGLVCGRVEV